MSSLDSLAIVTPSLILSTNQVIVNGRADGVGSTSKDLESIINKGSKGAKSSIAVEVTNGNVKVMGQKGGKALVLMARYDPRTVNIAIARGENGGREIPHRNVVRDVTSLGTWNGGLQNFTLPMSKGDGLEAAILVQASAGGPILAAARV